ncbi:hypothetical protein CAPTEDRAFT_204755 [Capitella teleta]|uniref:Sulfotransferase domain-containing protein n=1 Tax=Capitella teleta TaxID=283909 RepID=R7V058_CAPTE|nr:hypothetical protein CAPTEDRAFT_204755 [Capitella teleta]|eukprot:ELU12208.1 hypothetical protein CAPTEDRAFT_204755 [Capitella teleta]
MDLVSGIAKLGCYAVFRQVFILGRNIVWMLNGTYWQHRRCWKSPVYYAESAHVHNIAARRKLDVLLGPANFMDFTLTHHSFENPAYVLKDNVSLYQVTRDQAIFVEVPEEMDVWRCQHGSFLRQAQFNNAHRVITMPLHAFHTLADSIGDPDAELVFVQNTARCGSTLLVRVFEETEECVAFSEPDALNAVASYATHPGWKHADVSRVTRDAVRMLCKPVHRMKGQTRAYLMKLTILSIDGVPMLQELYPNSKHMFMYRDCLKVSESLMRIKEVLPLLKLGYVTANDKFDVVTTVIKLIGLSNEGCGEIRIKHQFQIGVWLWCIVMKKYENMVQSGVEMAAVAYEDIAGDPEYALTEIFKYCNVPLHLLKSGLRALEKDAQGNSELAASNIKTKKVDVGITPKVRDLCNSTLVSFGYPVLGRPCILPGTITHKNTIYWPPK